MGKTLTLQIESQVDDLRKVDEAVEKFGLAERWSAESLFQVRLALEEVVINIIKYAHERGKHAIEVSLAQEADRLTIEITDDGRSFNPLTDSPAPDLDASLEDRSVGGLGVYLTRSVMDALDYRRIDGKNHLTLVKRTGR